MVEDSPSPGAKGTFRQRLRNTSLVRKALETPIDPVLLQPPSTRIVVGLILIGASYLLCWPTIALLGSIAAWLRLPVLLLGAPVLYGFSWLVFAIGLVFIGAKSIGAGRSFGLLMVRRLAERFLQDRP